MDYIVVIEGEISLESRIDGELGTYYDIGREYEYYIGEYQLTPNVEGFSVETKNKVMLHDMQILEIPFAKVTNLSGGYTVTIA